MKKILYLIIILIIFLVIILKPIIHERFTNYDVYQYVKECKAELGITQKLPQLSCLDGNPVPIYVNKHEILSDNWEQLSKEKKCDNPHWLGGDMGCWTYSHLQVLNLDNDNIMVLNCRQKGDQHRKDWFRKAKLNLGLNQKQRKAKFEGASGVTKTGLYYLYNTFNDIGIILRNIRTGKSCYLTQYGEAVVGFLPPLDRRLPSKENFLKGINPDQARPPSQFPQEFWYRDANKAFRSPKITASAGCIDCHNAHGFKYSPYINSTHGIPDISAMTKLPFLIVGKPFHQHFRKAGYLQISSEPIDGQQQLCTRCHNMTTVGTCGSSIDYATGHPTKLLHTWLTNSIRKSWMPPVNMDLDLVKKHVAVLKCCCQNPKAKGCKSRKFGPTVVDLPKGFFQGGGWVRGEGSNLCKGIINSLQWSADEY